jgi:hypothetical protein
MRQRRFARARLSHPYMTRSLPPLLTITFTTAAFDRSSLWLFEASPYRVVPKGPPSSLVQLRIAVWTGDARDTMPITDELVAETRLRALAIPSHAYLSFINGNTNRPIVR